MKPFRYCPACGAPLEADDGTGDGLQCASCGRTWYRNAAPTASCAIVRDGRALIAVRAFEPEQGKVDTPGGFLRPGEDVLDGLRREVREELGLEIEVALSGLLVTTPHRYGGEGDWLISFGFEARAPTGEPKPADDVEAVHWVSQAELDNLEWAWPEHNKVLVERALGGISRPGAPGARDSR